MTTKLPPTASINLEDLVAQLHLFAQQEEAASKDANSDHWRGYKQGKADGFALAAQWIERDVMRVAATPLPAR